MNEKLRTYFDLVRLPNLCTAVADVLAGFLYAGGGGHEWIRLLAVSVASASLYAGGVVLNDVCDAAEDAHRRPQRPIPSGRVSRTTAMRISMGFLVVGWGLAAAIGLRGLTVATGLLLAIILYDAVLKSTPAAPGLMGLCRSLNLLLGMCAAGDTWAFLPSFDRQEAIAGAVLLPLFLLWLYVTSLTVLARSEAESTSRARARIGAAGSLAAVCGLAGLMAVLPEPHAGSLVPVAALALLVGWRGYATVSSDPAAVQRTVKTYVLSIILFDACTAWAARGMVSGLLVACWWIPAWGVGKTMRVT